MISRGEFGPVSVERILKLLGRKGITATFYVTFDGHRTNDFTPYVYVTTDGGRSFRSIANSGSANWSAGNFSTGEGARLINTGTFTTSFRRVLGVTPLQYLARVRMERAAAMLAEVYLVQQGRPQAEIAEGGGALQNPTPLGPHRADEAQQAGEVVADAVIELALMGQCVRPDPSTVIDAVTPDIAPRPSSVARTKTPMPKTARALVTAPSSQPSGRLRPRSP